MKHSSVLEVRDVSVRFGGLTALDSVSLTVAPSQVLGVIGPNGAGKTTLLNVLCGFIRPDEGQLLIGDRRYNDLRPHRLAGLGIARTLQGVGLFASLTAVENVMVGASGRATAGFWPALLGLPRSGRDERRLPAAPGYSEIAPASAAYFAYVNAHGGVYGRNIVYKYLDDAYNPTQTASVVRQLVLQDNVYAIFDGLGTPTHLAVESFLNAQQVPDVFVASGCDCWNMPTTAPETFGWQLDYIREGKILGQYIAKHFAGKKIGYFSQDDEFGMDGVKGLDDEIPKSMVVSSQTYDPTNTNVAPQVTALRASGAQVVVSFSIPAFTALLKLTSLKLAYSPTLAVSNVGSDPITLSGLLESFAKQGGATVNGNALTNGIITDGYAPPVGDTTNSWITLFKKVHDQYDAKAPLDGNVLYGMAVAYTFVQAMLKAGQNPTRADLVTAIQGGLAQGPVVAPYAYSATDHSGVTGAYIGVINNGVLTQQGPVLTTDTSASGAITTYTGTEPPAPASGIPAP